MSEKLASSDQFLSVEWEESTKAARAAAWGEIKDADDAVDVARKEHEVTIDVLLDARHNLKVAEAARDKTLEELEVAIDVRSAAWKAWLEELEVAIDVRSAAREELLIEQGVRVMKPASKISKLKRRLRPFIGG